MTQETWTCEDCGESFSAGFNGWDGRDIDTDNPVCEICDPNWCTACNSTFCSAINH